MTSGRAVPTGSVHPLRDVEASLGRQVLDHKVQTRRRWVFRTSVILSLTAVLLCSLVTWRRDEITVANQLQVLAGPVAELQDRVDELGRLPAKTPELSRGRLAFYASDADRFYASRVSEPVIIAATHPVQLLLTEDGRAVIIYRQGKIEVEWMTASEFDKALAGQKVEMEAFEQQRRSRPPNLP